MCSRRADWLKAKEQFFYFLDRVEHLKWQETMWEKHINHPISVSLLKIAQEDLVYWRRKYLFLTDVLVDCGEIPPQGF